MEDITRFATEVKRLRRRLGVSLSALAQQTSFSESYISKMLRGDRPLSPRVVKELDNALKAEGALERMAEQQEEEANVEWLRPAQLPPAVDNFVGREAYVRKLDAAVAIPPAPGAARTIVIEGAPGVGKTALLLHWAATIAKRFPGGVLFADLHGFAPGETADPGDVLNEFLRALGAPAETAMTSLESRTARFRSMLAAKPTLVVLDNVGSYQQVKPLLPGQGSVVLATTRVHLFGLAVNSGATRVSLDRLPVEEALDLLGRLAGPARVDAERKAAEVVVHRCGRLPLAVRIAAEHLATHPHLTLRAMADALAPEGHRLDMLATADESVDIRSVFDLSYRALKPSAAHMFRLLGIFPGKTIDAPAAAALTGEPLSAARNSLDALVAANLAETTIGDRVHLHDLLRLYAAERAEKEETPATLAETRDRVLRWYFLTGLNAGNTLAQGWAGPALTVDETGLSPVTFTDDYDAAVSWYENEGDTVLALARNAHEHGMSRLAWLLPCTLMPYWYLVKNMGAWLAGASAGLAAAREAGDELGMARSQHSLGAAKHELHRDDEALPHMEEAMRLHAHLEDDRGHAYAAFGLGTVYTGLGRHHDAQAMYTIAVELFAASDFDLGIAIVHHQLSTAYGSMNQLDDATQTAHQALEIGHRLGNTPVEGWARHRLGVLYQRQNQYPTALVQFDRALALRRASRERWGEAETQLARGETLVALDRLPDAHAAFEDAAAIFDDLHDPRALDAHAQLAALANRQ
ncbi:tetratricopeptide repeat protein [Amycolatopsis sp. NPDC059657]|uniref:helix-turn-helix domain-containing protein n=1 Tax=Amycolatopsis sp. NPDC059657 TaxID=3346899 RepID=UPI00366D8194